MFFDSLCIHLYFRNQFSTLVAGGGTGNVAMFLAEQLKHENGEVIYLDFSNQSMVISQHRAKVRKLRNIIFITDWIESTSRLGLYRMSFVQTSGVLHHLKSPSYGLKILKGFLKDPGGINIMVYGKSGRNPVYQMQKLFKTIHVQEEPVKNELTTAKHVLNIIPKTNWLTKSRDTLMGFDDVDIYDLFLHRRDISYSIDQLVNFVEMNGLHFVDYTPDSMDNVAILHQENELFDIHSNPRYNSVQKKHIKEYLLSTAIKHCVYASNIIEPEADIDDLNNIIYIHGNPIGFRDAVRQAGNQKKDYISLLVTPFSYPSKANIDLQRFTTKNIAAYGGMFRRIDLPINNFSYQVLCHLIRTEKKMTEGIPIETMYDKYRKDVNGNSSLDNMRHRFIPLYDALKSIGVILLRANNVEIPQVSKDLSHYLFKPVV